MKKAFYGIDAPYVILGLYSAFIALNLIFIGNAYGYWAAQWLFRLFPLTYLGIPVSVQWFLCVPHLCIIPSWMLYSSLHGKQTQRDFLLSKVRWTGTETVLDVGCGRGLLLIGAAERLTIGKAYGIDIWSSHDLSHNSKNAVESNAKIEGVGDRVIVLNQDARNMTFEDNAFDVVMTSLVIHNIANTTGRKQALECMIRVCKPGGIILIQDFQYIDEYAAVLRQLGLKDVRISTRYWRMFPPVRIIECRK